MLHLPALFDPSPKNDPRFLYGRDKELRDLVTHIKEKRWVILLGPRRIGKTSLARCAIAKIRCKNVLVDSRANNDFAGALVSSLIGAGGSLQAQVGLAATPLPLTIGVSYNRSAFKEGLDRLLKRIDRLVVIIDEVQWLRNPRGVTMLLAHIYDYHYDRVTLVITGSAVGVMRSIAEPGAKSPLYGRAIVRMEVGRWSPSVSLGFLKEGCNEKRIHYHEDFMAKVVDTLDGIPGWLTLYGYNYSLDPREAVDPLRKTLDEALKIVSEEMESVSKIAVGWHRQLKILKELSVGPRRFMEMAEAVRINNQALSRHLDMLQRLRYIEKDNEGRYSMIDPILIEYVKRKGRRGSPI